MGRCGSWQVGNGDTQRTEYEEGIDLGLEVRPIQSSVEREACYHVRMVVFVEEQAVPPWEELDADDESALHVAAIQDGVIVGTARLVDKGDGLGKIGRVAVLKENRGEGIGRLLMEALLRVAADRFKALTLDAQLQVIPFYEKLGFQAHGDVFLDCEIEHRRMSRELHIDSPHDTVGSVTPATAVSS